MSLLKQWKGNYLYKVTSNRTLVNNATACYWPCKPCMIPLVSPPNSWGRAIPWKYTRDKHPSEANHSCPRTAKTLAKCQKFYILVPHCPNLSYLAGSSPSFHRVQYFGSISDIVLSTSFCRIPELTGLPLQTTLSAESGSSFLPVRFPPVQFLLSPAARGWVIHMESQVDSPFSPDTFQTAPCLRLTAFPGSWNWNLVSKLTLPLLSKEVYLTLLKSLPLLNK